MKEGTCGSALLCGSAEESRGICDLAVVLYFEIMNDDICGSSHARDFETVIGDACNSIFSLDLEKVNDILCVLISAPCSKKGIDEACDWTSVLEEKANDLACNSTWALDLKKAHELENH